MNAQGNAIARAQGENGFFNRSGGYHYAPSPPLTHIGPPEPNYIPEHLNVLRGCCPLPQSGIGVTMSYDKDGAAEILPPQAMSGPLKFQITMASDPRLLAVVRSTISELAAVWGLGDEGCRGVTRAVDEALSNIIRHAYKNRSDGEIELSCRTDADCLEFTFVDRGEPADRSRICAQPLDDTSLCGRGTHLIRQIMDQVYYERVGEVNRLRLKKYLPGAKRKA